jgi:hypothetical protein
MNRAPGERSEKEKFTHAEVNYERTSSHPGKECGNCKHVIEAMSGTRCQGVKSPIDLGGWCKRWEKQ